MAGGTEMAIHERLSSDRADAARADISAGLLAYLEEAMRTAERLAATRNDDRERRRVAAMLERDREDEAAERRRAEAEVEIAEGRFASLSDATIGPTREQLAHGSFRNRVVDKHKGSVRAVVGVRRVLTDRLVQLHGRGVLDDDMLAACAWYRRQWEATGFGQGPQTSKFSLAPGGRPRRDHLPATEAGFEAWQLYRFARDGIPGDVLTLFELVVLGELGLEEAAVMCRWGRRRAAAALRRAALSLHGTIAHMLPVRVL